MTRNTTSASAKALAEKSSNISLLAGDLDDCAAIFAAAGGKGAVWGVFSVQVPSMKKGEGAKEETQGKALVDAAVENDVKYFVYSGVDRGGDKSDQTPTEIPHFISKHNIEVHLKNQAEGTGMDYTILRPVAFMDNLGNNLFGRMFAAMWLNMGDTPLQLVGTRDIGVFAALAFSKAEEFKGKAITLVGDEMTQKQGNEVFWKCFGRSMPRAYSVFGSLLQWMIPEVGTMFRWFVESGYGGDVAECRRLNPAMQNLESWYQEESGFKR